jgi:PAS domain S-box-containing protein
MTVNAVPEALLGKHLGSEQPPMPSKDSGGLLLRPNGQILFASTYFCDLVGIKYDTVAGMSCLDFLFPEDRDAALDLFATTKFPHTGLLRFRFRRRDGTGVWTNIQVAPLKAGAAGGVYAVKATIAAANGDR